MIIYDLQKRKNNSTYCGTDKINLIIYSDTQRKFKLIGSACKRNVRII